ncbi:ATP-binding protein [Gilvimarinus sp. F26214L]|uniref:ATP-binding protein n=1 Tax=Gilvimarinus sp. DZF01 TaxID=3461371 RepID=UPI004045EBDF
MLSRIKHSISNKIMLVVIATTLTALLVYAAAMLAFEIRGFHDGVVRDLNTQASLIAEVSVPALEFADPMAARENLYLLRNRPGILRAAILDADGQRFAQYVGQDEDGYWPDVPLRPARYFVEGGRIHLWRPIGRDGNVLGTVYIAAQYDIIDRIDEAILVLAGVLAASLGLALIIAGWLRQAVTRPIYSVTSVARQVMRSRDFSLRAQRSSEDEIGVLVDAFNDMLSEVERRARALEESNRNLEREMSERQAAENALRQADRRKDEFLATLAHELRNPLAPMMNGLRILEMDTQDPAKQEEARAVLDRQLKKMVRLVDDLLDVSRISTGKLQIAPEVVEAQSVVRDAVETSRDEIDGAGHALTVELPAEPLYVRADPLRLAQVFSNLLNNAAKYTEPGGHIHLMAQQDGEQVSFSVSDTGIGIAADRLDDVFDMFTQVDQSLERSYQGLGVGLALSRRLVELHGGELQVASEGPGRGSTFTVRLDRVEAPAAPLQSEAAPAPQSRGRRILLVDDNVDFVDTMAALLADLGHEVLVLHDARAALEKAPRFAPEFAFLDIGMPGMSGYDLAHQLRRLPEMESCILIAATGWGQSKDLERSRKAGFDHHLVKPVELADVLAIIEGAACTL